MYHEVSEKNVLPLFKGDGKSVIVHDNATFVVTTEENSRNYNQLVWYPTTMGIIAEYGEEVTNQINNILTK